MTGPSGASSSSSSAAAAAAVERSLVAIAADGRSGIWIELVDPAVARAAAEVVDRRVAAGEVLPLAGRTLAVKDNIDVAGLPTTAGCPAYAYRPEDDAPVVRALVDAGAVVVGKTNLDQFATGLVGTRSPYGVCPNAHWPGLVSGGSSSGSAVAVASRMVDLALGTDTAGSGRVPAAANGIIGVKPTRGRLSTAGVVPACRSLDCVSVFARTVAEASVAVAVAAGSPVAPVSPVSPVDGVLRLGVPGPAELSFDGDPAGPGRFERALASLVAATGSVGAAGASPAGASVAEVDLAPFSAAAALLYDGSFVAERYDAVGAFVDAHLDEVDPVVGPIISAAAAHPGWAVFRDQAELRRLVAVTAPVWASVDVLVVPSVPRVPTVAEVAADPVGVNAMLGTYTNFVNLLDLCAVTVPVPAAAGGLDGPPPSLTLIAPAGADDRLATVASLLA